MFEINNIRASLKLYHKQIVCVLHVTPCLEGYYIYGKASFNSIHYRYLYIAKSTNANREEVVLILVPIVSGFIL
jgi:hypothetical protein